MSTNNDIMLTFLKRRMKLFPFSCLWRNIPNTLSEICQTFFFSCWQISTFASQAEKTEGLRQRDGGPPEGKQQPPPKCSFLDGPTLKSLKRKFLNTVFSWLSVTGCSDTLNARLKIKSVKSPGIHFWNLEAQVNFPL